MKVCCAVHQKHLISGSRKHARFLSWLTIAKGDHHLPRKLLLICESQLCAPIHTGARPLSDFLRSWKFLPQLTTRSSQKLPDDPVDTKDTTVVPAQSPKNSTHETVHLKNSKDRQRKSIWLAVADALKFNSLFKKTTPVNLRFQNPSFEREHEKLSSQISSSTELFLNKYNTNLDLILKKSNPPSNKLAKLKVPSVKSLKSKETVDMYSKIYYPFKKQTNVVCVKTSRYDSTLEFLKREDIPCDELDQYPSIQNMEHSTILECVHYLKAQGIHRVFSLFLLERTATELKQKSGVIKITDKSKALKPITSLRVVKEYLELCQMLEKQDLDIRGLMEHLGSMGNFLEFHTLYKRVKKLLELGATASDILSNLEILYGHEIFDEKIKLYKMSANFGKSPFPLDLFKEKTLVRFKEMLAIAKDVEEMCKMLDVSISSFQTCWGFRKHSSSKIQYKIRMCLAAGISKKDIFQNLGALMGLSLSECHSVTNCFRETGLPASMFILRDMLSVTETTGTSNVRAAFSSPDKNVIGDAAVEKMLEEDWAGEAKPLVTGDFQVIADKLGLTCRKKSSTKKERKNIFNLIQSQLNLDKDMNTLMYSCRFTTSSVEMIDIPRNLDFLLSQQFSKQDIATCPLILAHPHSELMRVVYDFEKLVVMQLLSVPEQSSASAATLSAARSSDSQLPAPVMGAWSLCQVSPEDQPNLIRPHEFIRKLKSNRVQLLNAYEYFLEKENSFSLSDAEVEHFAGSSL